MLFRLLNQGKPADAHLLRELECVVCKEMMLRPYMICQEGHASACLPCYGKLKACPLCRQKLLSPPIRLVPLEGMAQDLLVPCPHTTDGCPLSAPLRYADAGAHAGKCDWRKVRAQRESFTLIFAYLAWRARCCPFCCYIFIHYIQNFIGSIAGYVYLAWLIVIL